MLNKALLVGNTAEQKQNIATLSSTGKNVYNHEPKQGDASK